MKTIIYQAQPIHVDVVGFMNDERPWGHRDEVTVTLCRDEAGIYYLQRESHHNHDKQTSSPDYARKHAQEYDYRSLVHRIGITAATLWVLHRAPNGDGWNLRCDAADALMEDRGYDDPNPVYWRYGQNKRAAAGAAGETTVAPVTPAPAQTAKRGNVPVEAEVPDDFPALAARLGRSPKRLLWELAEDLCAKSPSTLGTVEQKEYPVLATEHLLTVEPGTRRFSFDYPATRKMCGRRRTVELTDAQMDRTSELAALFGLDPMRFLSALADQNNLPGQPKRLNNPLEDLLHAGHIAFTCMDETMAKRIARAASARSQTMDEFVAYAVATDVDMWEETMLLHPATGELLAAEYEELYTEREDKYLLTAPPIGCENDPQFKSHEGRQYMRFGAYLTPEQLERLEYPHMVSDCATDEEVTTLLVPFDEEGSPHLEVGGKRVQLGTPVVEAEEVA